MACHVYKQYKKELAWNVLRIYTGCFGARTTDLLSFHSCNKTVVVMFTDVLHAISPPIQHAVDILKSLMSRKEATKHSNMI